MAQYGFAGNLDGSEVSGSHSGRTERCLATVHHPKHLRRTGAGRFERHHVKGRCKRRATWNGYCWQHRYFYRSGLPV